MSSDPTPNTTPHQSVVPNPAVVSPQGMAHVTPQIWQQGIQHQKEGAGEGEADLYTQACSSMFHVRERRAAYSWRLTMWRLM